MVGTMATVDIVISFERYQKLRAMFDPVDGADIPLLTTYSNEYPRFRGLLTNDDPLTLGVDSSNLQQTR